MLVPPIPTHIPLTHTHTSREGIFSSGYIYEIIYVGIKHIGGICWLIHIYSCCSTYIHTKIGKYRTKIKWYRISIFTLPPYHLNIKTDINKNKNLSMCRKCRRQKKIMRNNKENERLAHFHDSSPPL